MKKKGAVLVVSMLLFSSFIVLLSSSSGDYLDVSDENALNFADGDYVDASVTANAATGSSKSYSFWIRSDGSQTNTPFIMGALKRGSPDQKIQLRHYDDEFSFALGDSSGTQSTAAFNETNHPYRDGDWHNIICVRDTNDVELSIYLDGNMVSSIQDNTSDVNTNLNYYLMGLNDDGSVHADTKTGDLDEVIIYDDAIIDSEASEIYNGGHPTDNITAYYPVDEGTGSTLYDDSGNNNDGTINGATWITTSTSLISISNRNPPDGETFSGITSKKIKAQVNHSDGVNMDVSFYNASDWSLIGENTTVSNGTYEQTWSGLSSDNEYSWTVNVTDNNGNWRNSTVSSFSILPGSYIDSYEDEDMDEYTNNLVSGAGNIVYETSNVYHESTSIAPQTTGSTYYGSYTHDHYNSTSDLAMGITTQMTSNRDGTASLGAGISLRLQDKDNCYIGQINYANQDLEILSREAGSATEIANVSGTWTEGNWYDLWFEAHGDTLTVHAEQDGNDLECSTTDSTFTSGDNGIWFSVGSNQPADTDVLYLDYLYENEAVDISVKNPSPFNGATDISTSISELTFDLNHSQGSLMNYSVETTPNIGSTSGTDVGNGTYSCSVSGLSKDIQYIWYVNVTDGEVWNNQTYKFTTEVGNVINIGVMGDIQNSNAQWVDDIINNWNNNTDKGWDKLDFGIQMGDWVSADEGTYYATETAVEESVNQVNDHIETPYRVITGDHDTADYDTRSSHPQRGLYDVRNESGITKDSYAFVHDNVMFISMMSRGTIDVLHPEQVEWFDNLINRYPDMSKVLFTHKYIFNETMGEDNNNMEAFYMEENSVTGYGKQWLYNHINKENGFIATIHGHAEEVPSDTFGGNYKVLNGTVHCGVPTQKGEQSGSIKDSSDTTFLQISNNSVRIKMYDEEAGEWQDNRTESGFSNTVSETGTTKQLVPMYLQDNETGQLRNYIVSDNVKVNIFGANNTELAYNSEFEWFNGPRPDLDDDGEIAYQGFIGSADSVPDGAVRGMACLNGSKILKSANSKGTDTPSHDEGRVPYNMLRPVQNKQYNFSMYANASSSCTDALDVSINYLSTDVTNIVDSQQLFTNLDLSTSMQEFSTQFTVPDNSNIWIAQVVFESKTTNRHYIENYSIKRTHNGDLSENPSVIINGNRYSYNGDLSKYEKASFDISDTIIQASNTIEAEVQGNKQLMVELEYVDPHVKFAEAGIGIDNKDSNQVDVTTERYAEYNREIRAFPLSNPSDITTSMNTRTRSMTDYYYIENTQSSSETFDLSDLVSLPEMATVDVTSITSSSVTFVGDIISLGDYSEGDAYFEFRETGQSDWTETSNETRSSTGEYDNSVSGLAPSTEYEFRAAITVNPTSTGSIITFSTSDAEYVDTLSPDFVDETTVMLRGELLDMGGESSVNVSFRWRAEGEDTWQQTPNQTMNSTGEFEYELTGLDENGSYEYKAVVDEIGGEEYEGDVVTFDMELADILSSLGYITNLLISIIPIVIIIFVIAIIVKIMSGFSSGF